MAILVLGFMSKRRVAKTIQVSLVEDDAGVRANLARMIDGTPGFRCQAEYSDGPSALKGIMAQECPKKHFTQNLHTPNNPSAPNR
jgi:hypothetical protein